jgi:hypothetical protein
LDIQSKYPDFGRVEKKYLKKIKKSKVGFRQKNKWALSPRGI